MADYIMYNGTHFWPTFMDGTLYNMTYEDSLALHNRSRVYLCRDYPETCNNITVLNGSIGSGDVAVISDKMLVTWIVSVLFALIALVGVSGNVLVLLVVSMNRQMRSSTNVLILSLALADLFFIIMVVPFTAVQIIEEQWPFGDTFCKIFYYSSHVTSVGSVYTLVFMSVDRYVAVVHSARASSIRTCRNACIAVAIMWVVICVVLSKDLVDHGTEEYHFGGQVYVSCIHKQIMAEYLQGQHKTGQIFYMAFFILGYALPLLVIIALYGRMIYFLISRKSLVQGKASSQSQRHRKRATIVVSVVVAMFAVCWLPLHIRFLITYFGTYPDSRAMYWFQILSTCLAYMNSCVNPILYNFLSEQFRKSFKSMLGCKKPSAYSTHGTQLQMRRTVNCDNDEVTGGRRQLQTPTCVTEFNSTRIQMLEAADNSTRIQIPEAADINSKQTQSRENTK